jgi:FkbM family methyltransferase
VAPARVARTATDDRWRDRAVPAFLRLLVAIARRAFRGRGVGYSCTAAARAMSYDGLLTFQLHRGGSFQVSARDRYWLVPLLLDQGYEPEVDHFLGSTLDAGDVFFDCGANLGLWSVAAAQVIDDPARVVAVEPGAETFTGLRTNWELNGRNFTPLKRALSDSSGTTVEFFASRSDPASATLVEGLSPVDAHRELVQTISLGDLLRMQEPRVPSGLAFVKLDVEGLESRVLSAAHHDVEGRTVLLYEDHGRDTAHKATSQALAQGFDVAFLGDDGSLQAIRPDSLQRLSELKRDRGRGYNLVAVLPSGAAADRLGRAYPDVFPPSAGTP